MNALIVTYAYQFQLVDALIISPIILIIAMIMIVAIAAVSPYVYGYILYVRRERERLEKKRTISNLRIMNEIQGELEAEVKEARIRASLKA